MHILDIAENSLAAGARRIGIRIEEDLTEDRMVIEIVDDGAGMDEEMARRALDPFVTTRTTRRVGLGLPLLAEACRACGGELTLQSRPGQGTAVRATFQRSHIDRQPLGNMGDTLITLIVGHPEVDLCYEHRKGEVSFTLDTAVIKAELGSASLRSPAVISALRGQILSALKELES